MRSMVFFNYLLESGLIGSGVIVLVLLARRLFRAKIGSRLIYASWLIAALRLLLPLSLPNPLMNELRPGLSTDMLARPVADQIRTRIIDMTWDVAAALKVLTGGGSMSHAFETLGLRTYQGETGLWFMLIYGVIGMAIAAWMIGQNLRFHRFIKRNRVGTIEGEELLLYHRMCVRFLVKPVPVYYVDRLAAPCTLGVFHPMIVLPKDSAPVYLQPMLCHQLGHVKSHDVFWSVIRSLCCVIHWANPLVWLGARLCREDAEMSCDELAKAKMNDGDRIAYADALAAAHGAEGSSLALLATDAAAGQKHLKKRMTAVLSNVHVKRWSVTLAAAVCVLVLTASFLTGEKYAPVRITVLPQVRWRAGDEIVQSSREAVGYARRFLENPYVNVDTSKIAFATQLENDGKSPVWRVEGSIAISGVRLLLRFRQNGTLLEYDGLYQAGEVDEAVHEATAPALPESLRAYLHGFTDACLPHQKWVDAAFDGDAVGSEQHLFSLKLNLLDKTRNNALHNASAKLLIGETVRVVGFRSAD